MIGSRYILLFVLQASFFLLPSWRIMMIIPIWKLCHAFVCSSPATLSRPRFHQSAPSVFLALDGSDTSTPRPPPTLNVAIVGAGPSGLLLTHLLLQQENTKVTLVEGRSDPRGEEAEERAYALGVGMRGRTAIRQVDEQLWTTVRNRGYESERFQLHVGGLVIPLRSERDGRKDADTANAGGTAGTAATVEPSVLTYQTDLCGAMVDELERRYKTTSDRLNIFFGTKVDSCDLDSMTITVNDATTSQETKRDIASSQPYGLIVGSDGVNSIVRSAMKECHPGFQCTTIKIPGEFKVVRLPMAPPKVDPTSVSLLLPKAGSCTAFIEPTGNDGSCCILFAGRGDTPILYETKNVTAVVEALNAGFPQWKDLSEMMANELMNQEKPGSASSVVCNTYHYNDKAALVGDAAHATGGVSGQGVNSALQDCVVLANFIRDNRHDLATALLKYSERQVPEGKALYDLSFGPKPTGLKALVWAFITARNTLFRGRFGIGKPPLQTRLTTTLTPFSEIRKESDKFYLEPFPENSEFRHRLVALHEESMKRPGDVVNNT